MDANLEPLEATFLAQIESVRRSEHMLPIDPGSGDLVPPNFDAVFKSIMEQKGQTLPIATPSGTQRASQDGSDLSTIFHQSSIGSLADQLRHSASGLDKFLSELPVPGLDSNGIWGMDGTPLNFAKSSSTPTVDPTRPSTHAPHFSQTGTRNFHQNNLSFDERPPMISVEVLPSGDTGLKTAARVQQESADAGHLTSQMQAQGVGEEEARLGRKRRRKGELPPKLAAILANERSSEEDGYIEEVQAEEAAIDAAKTGSQHTYAEARRDRNREAARRVREKRQQAILGLRAELGSLATQNDGLTEQLRLLMEKLEQINKDNMAMRELLKCLDIPEDARAEQPILELLDKAKRALSGPPNPPPTQPYMPPAKKQKTEPGAQHSSEFSKFAAAQAAVEAAAAALGVAEELTQARGSVLVGCSPSSGHGPAIPSLRTQTAWQPFAYTANADAGPQETPRKRGQMLPPPSRAATPLHLCTMAKAAAAAITPTVVQPQLAAATKAKKETQPQEVLQQTTPALPDSLPVSAAQLLCENTRWGPQEATALAGRSAHTLPALQQVHQPQTAMRLPTGQGAMMNAPLSLQPGQTFLPLAAKCTQNVPAAPCV